MRRPQSLPVVVYSHWVPREGPAILRPFCRIVQHHGRRVLAGRELARRGQRAAAICYSMADRIDESLILSCPSLRILAGFGKGFSNVDVAAATRRGVWVTNIPTELTEPTADLAWSLILAAARQILPGDAFVRSGRFSGWLPRDFLGSNVHGKVLGLIGFGQIGQAIARRAKGFSMRVIYYDRRRATRAIEKKLSAVYVSSDRLFREADFVCLATPLTPETFHLVGPRELAMVKPSAYLINPARGSLVQEAAVARALARGRLLGYAADVFEMEDTMFPRRPRYVHRGLIDVRDRTVLTPHIGTAVLETRSELARRQARNVLAALRGERPADAVNEVSLQPALISGANHFA